MPPVEGDRDGVPFVRGGVLGDVRVQFVEQSFEKVEDVVRQWMVERPEDVLALESEAAKATSLRLNDAVKPFTLLFDFPVGFVVVICFDDAAAIVWFVGAFSQRTCRRVPGRTPPWY
ncbi:hypothetical protein [Bifidobacterium longum]|uniref:hypothetical protein n=1 Tax=Bifidobacterium longum TaxID=216816 RepID=UPI002072FEBC|nr:hypothetical protein [Bifidobacterium longum]